MHQSAVARRRQISLDEQGRYEHDGQRQVADAAAQDPLEVVMTEELRAAIVEGLQRLTTPYRSALELASLGYRPLEVAEILQLEPARVRVILFRARKVMRAFLNTRFSRAGRVMNQRRHFSEVEIDSLVGAVLGRRAPRRRAAKLAAIERRASRSDSPRQGALPPGGQSRRRLPAIIGKRGFRSRPWSYWPSA